MRSRANLEGKGNIRLLRMLGKFGLQEVIVRVKAGTSSASSHDTSQEG
jgi:hypothetical protein